MEFAKNISMDTLASMELDVITVVAQFANRMASYMIPGGGWVKAVMDMSKVANSGGKFALDAITSPKIIPFTLEGGEAYFPFVADFKQYSYLMYPDGVNIVDVTSNGKYRYESYFLYGNQYEENDFTAWNINNRTATLAVSGVTYSYEMQLGEYDDKGKQIIMDIYNNEWTDNSFADFRFRINN